MKIPVDLELVLAADVSYSMDVEDQRVQRQGYVDAMRDAEVIRAIKSGRLGRIAVTYVEWGGTALQVVSWTIVDGADSAGRFAGEIDGQPLWHISYTWISNALAFARGLIRSNHYEGARRVSGHSVDPYFLIAWTGSRSAYPQPGSASDARCGIFTWNDPLRAYLAAGFSLLTAPFPPNPAGVCGRWSLCI